MSTELTKISEGLGGKDFWKKPEGKFAKWIVVPALVVGGVYLFGSILPFIVALLQNLVTVIILGVVSIGLYFLFFSKQMRHNWAYFFQAFCRGVLSVVVDLSPEAVLEGKVSRQKDLERTLNENKGGLRGIMKGLKEKAFSARREMQASRDRAKAAHEAAQGGDLRFTLTFRSSVRSAKRSEERVLSYEQMYRTLEVLFRALEKYSLIVRYYIDDMEDQVKHIKEKRKSMGSAYKAFMAARGVLLEGGQDAVAFEMAVERMLNDYNSKLGEIEEFVSITSDLVNGFDLEQMSIDANALQMFERWEQQADDIVLGSTEKQRLIAESNDPLNILDVDREVPVFAPPPPEKPSQKYRDLLGL